MKLNLRVLFWISLAVLLVGCSGALDESTVPTHHSTAAVGSSPVEKPITEPTMITFDDLLLGIQPDAEFEPQLLTARVRELEGQRVCIGGVMIGAFAKMESEIDHFILLRHRARNGGAGMPADHLIEVKMRSGKVMRFTSETVQVEGILRITPHTVDGQTWTIYQFEDATATVQ